MFFSIVGIVFPNNSKMKKIDKWRKNNESYDLGLLSGLRGYFVTWESKFDSHRSAQKSL